MPRKNIFLVAICLVFGILVVVILFAMSDRINQAGNGFERTFPPQIIRFKSKIDIKYNSYYVAGFSSKYVYLGNYTATIHLLAADHSIATNYVLTDTQHVQLPELSGKKIAWRALRVAVDSPNIYMLESITPSLLKGTLFKSPKGKIFCSNISYTNLEGMRFSASKILSNSSSVFRIYNDSLKQNILIKTPFDSLYRQSLFALEKQQDGVFSTDGQLHYSTGRNVLIYLYHYRNQFICLDTNLNLVYKGNTIDTIAHAQIKIDQILTSSRQETTFSAPPLTVNKKSCVSGKWLFVNSGLMANNEDKNLFNDYDVVDIYSLEDGKYNFSFYLPRHKNMKISDFAVRDNTLVALYDHYLLTFQLDFSNGGIAN